MKVINLMSNSTQFKEGYSDIPHEVIKIHCLNLKIFLFIQFLYNIFYTFDIWHYQYMTKSSITQKWGQDTILFQSNTNHNQSNWPNQTFSYHPINRFSFDSTLNQFYPSKHHFYQFESCKMVVCQAVWFTKYTTK